MIRRSIFIVLLVSIGSSVGAEEPPTRDASRGELLYSTHCIACHSSQVHWRDKKLARNWLSLQVEVRHWEGFSGLAWTEGDVTAVARYLNSRYYHYPTAD